MPRRLWVMVAIVGMVATLGCTRDMRDDYEGRSPEAQRARAVLDAVVRGEADSILSQFDGAVVNSDMAYQVRALTGEFPQEAAQRVRIVSAARHRSTVLGGATTEDCLFFFESNYSHKTIVTQVIFRNTGAGFRLFGLHTAPSAVSLDELNGFTLANKSPFQFLFLALMGVAVGIHVAAIRVWLRRRKQLRRRVLWFLAILVGLPEIALNWRTGEIGVRFLQMHFFSVGFARDSALTPWVFILGIPIGAIILLIKERRGELVPPSAVPPPMPPSESIETAPPGEESSRS